MNKAIAEYFSSANIEYFAILSYADCIETNKRIIEREGFDPKSVIVYLLPYYTGETENISRYAASLDYHIAIGEINLGLAEVIKSLYPSAELKGYGDHSPIDERRAALIGGLGIVGENGLIINEKYGSYIFIGDVVTDIDPAIIGAEAPKEYGRCHGCSACKNACPTGIIRGEGIDCLSAITQRKGELSEDEKELMRKYNTAWGCDLCQTACPYNRNPIKTPLDFFYRDRISRLTRGALNAMDDEEFNTRAFAWRKRKTIERNLEILEKSK